MILGGPFNRKLIEATVKCNSVTIGTCKCKNLRNMKNMSVLLFDALTCMSMSLQ